MSSNFGGRIKVSNKSVSGTIEHNFRALDGPRRVARLNAHARRSMVLRAVAPLLAVLVAVVCEDRFQCKDSSPECASWLAAMPGKKCTGHDDELYMTIHCPVTCSLCEKAEAAWKRGERPNPASTTGSTATSSDPTVGASTRQAGNQKTTQGQRGNGLGNGGSERHGLNAAAGSA